MVDTQTAEKIHLAIEEKLRLGSSYMDALVEHANANGIEIEVIAEIVKKSPILKEKIRTEAQERKMLKKVNDKESAASKFFN